MRSQNKKKTPEATPDTNHNCDSLNLTSTSLSHALSLLPFSPPSPSKDARCDCLPHCRRGDDLEGGARCPPVARCRSEE